MRPEVKGVALHSRDVLVRAAWWVALAAYLVWWAPAILFRVGALVAGRVRFGLVMAIGDALKAVGRRDSAARLYEREAKRCRARMVAVRARRGW